MPLLTRLPRRLFIPISDLCSYLELLQLPAHRSFHASSCRYAKEKDEMAEAIREGGQVQLTAEQRLALAQKRARSSIKSQEDKARAQLRFGSLSSDSILQDKMLGDDGMTVAEKATSSLQEKVEQRDFANMARVLDPNPDARARWQRKMLIRHVRKGGRLTKEMAIARSERKHLSKSHFYATSVKKLMPLARQIAGKPIDEAILQMRFSKKKQAQEILKHLVQARNEAVAVKGMGLRASNQPAMEGTVVLDPSITPANDNQKHNKKLKDPSLKSDTDIYIAQAWINRGPYGQGRPEFRARGKMNITYRAYAGISVLLKEEKTKIREKAEKEAKDIRQRMGKNMWTQLPDRPITNQSQYVLW